MTRVKQRSREIRANRHADTYTMESGYPAYPYKGNDKYWMEKQSRKAIKDTEYNRELTHSSKNTK